MAEKPSPARIAYLTGEVKIAAETLCSLVEMQMPAREVEIVLGESPGDSPYVSRALLMGDDLEIARTEKYLAAANWLHRQLNKSGFYTELRGMIYDRPPDA